MSEFSQIISHKLKISVSQIEKALTLFDEGATIPFIARYRKDVTGNLDEVQLQDIQQEAKFQKEFSERKQLIEKTIIEQGKMTELLQKNINEATTISQLEDIYLPYKPKRKTKASIAKEKGLEPLAIKILLQESFDIQLEAKNFVNEQVATIEEALSGANDIIAENINENVTVRTKLRNFFEKEALLHCEVVEAKKNEAIKYKDYFDFKEPIVKMPSHRILAILRAFLEGYLRVSIAPDSEIALEIMNEIVIVNSNETTPFIKKAIQDAYKRLLHPSLETEFRTALKIKADEEAIDVFALNLRQLLLSAPLGSKRILAIDPGYRTGCKVVCLDESGNLVKTSLIFIHEKNSKLDDAEYVIRDLFQKYKIEAFAIGDGTAGRETQQFIQSLKLGIPIFMVNEDGASIYSASEIGREEFPNEDITVRGSVSIGRRLMDPLAELVKIDPKSIGVGQYQHDVSQVRLKDKLDHTVISCVNSVGVNLNTASKNLLSYVSGIGPALAENIIIFRKDNGHFKSRKQMLDVPRLGQKVFEQCAGFLKIPTSENPLDNSTVHPEAYSIVAKMASDLNVEIKELIQNEILINQIPIDKYVNNEIGKLGIQDILKELKKPGLDPRPEAQSFEFANIFKIEDVNAGMIVPGVVTNMTRFGVFVDIGVKQDGLVHISEISHKYISDPSEILKLNDQVTVKVLEVDVVRKRINLSIKQVQENLPAKAKEIKPKQEPMPTFSDALSSLKTKFKK